MTGVILLLLVMGSLAIDQTCDPPSKAPSKDNHFQLNTPCPQNSHCLPSGYCDCDLGYIGDCTQKAFRLQDSVVVNTTLTNQTYTFFQVIGDPSEYTLLAFSLCHTSENSRQEAIDVWEDNGTIKTFSKDNAEGGGKTYPIKDGCITLTTPFMVFGLKTNGETEGFILGLKLVQSGQIPITLSVAIQTIDFWGLMTKLLFILGGCFLLTLSIAVGYLAYKWRRRQLFYQNINRPKNIQHFDQFMPKMKLSGQQRQKMTQQMCAICLIGFGNSWLRKTVCDHIFHQECLDEWCKANLNCPICRKSFDIVDLRQQSSTDETMMSASLRENILE